MAVSEEIRALIDATPFVDTHEHLFEESKRIKALEGANADPLPVAAPDIGLLFSHYSDSDLESAGMNPAATQRLFSYDVEPCEKWKMIEPYYRSAYHTGYLQSVRESVRALYGEDDLTARNVDAISERIRARIKPGFYGPILREAANLEHAQINNLDAPIFMETEQPNLLCQDMNIKVLSTDLDVKTVSGMANREVTDLKDWHEIIDWCFATYGPRAIAIKSTAAYRRRLDYAQVGADDAAPLFKRYLKDKDNLYKPEYKPLQDHLFNYCVRKAIEYNLPLKLHTGYYAHSGRMPLQQGQAQRRRPL